MWTALFVLLFLMPYRSDGDGGSHRLLRIIGMPFLGLLAGWSGENACLAAAVALVLLLVRRALLKKPFRAWMFTGAAGFIAGAALLFFSPAQALKADNMGGLGSLRVWLGRIPDVTLDAIRYLWLPLALGLILLALSIVQSRGQGFMYWLRKYSNGIVWLCAAIVAAYCMCAAPYFPLRAWCCSGVLAAVTVLSVFAEIRLPEKLPPRRSPRRMRRSAARLRRHLRRRYLGPALHPRRRQGEGRERHGAEGRRADGRVRRGRLRPRALQLLRPCRRHQPGPGSWQNEALALYYGVEHVILLEQGQ